MSIDERCKNQQPAADRLFMDFKYTKPGSDEQMRALASFNSLVCIWAEFLLEDGKFDLNQQKPISKFSYSF